MALITLEQAKLQLRIDDENDEHDEHLEELIEDASGIVLDYLKKSETEWQTTSGEPEEVPRAVISATKLVLQSLFEGDDEPLSQAVKDLLHRYRDPALA